MIQSAALTRVFQHALLAAILSISHAQISGAQGMDTACRSPTLASSRILVGRFMTAGSSNDAPANLELVLQAVIGAYFNSSASTWSPARSPELEKTLGPLIEAVFSQGPGGDASAQRARSLLSSELKARGCDYVIGGEVNVGRLFIITPYLFDVRAATLEVPFEPVVGEDIFRTARDLTVRLAQILATRDSTKGGIKTRLLVGCFGALNIAAREQADTISRAIARAVSGEISGDPHFPGIAVRPLDPGCNDDAISPRDEQTRTLVFTGEIEFVGKRVALRPRFEIKEPQGWRVVITMDRILQQESLEELIRQYTNEVRTFAVAFGGPALEGAAFELLSRPRHIIHLDALAAEFDALLNEARYTDAFGLSYRVISDNLDSSNVISLSRFTIGRALLKRSETLLALSQLIKALAIQEGLPPLTRAQLNETLGSTYTDTGALPSAISRLEDASAAYQGLGLVAQAATVRKTIAGVRIKMGDFKRAKADLQSVPNLSGDFDALLLLAQVSLKMGDLDGRQGALQWVGDASKVRPNASEAQTAAAEIYGAIGKRALQEKKTKLAEQAFRMSLGLEENTQYRYLAGFSAYEDGGFDRAIDDYRGIVNSTAPAPFRLTEAAWLNLLESYILAGNYIEADRQGEQATQQVFLQVPESQLLALYLRTVARALLDPQQGASIFEQDPVYQQTLARVPTRGVRLNWNNRRLSNYYERILMGNPEKLRKIKELTQQLFPTPPKG